MIHNDQCDEHFLNILQKGTVTSLVHNAGKVTGVELRRKGSGNDDNEETVQKTSSGDTEILDADFVVNCSGAKSKVEQWLKDMGYGVVPREELNQHLTYCSIVLQGPKDLYKKKGWLAYSMCMYHIREEVLIEFIDFKSCSALNW
jgi:hypothetical protein